MNTCRICKKCDFETHEELAKYGVRHYAHFSCGLQKWGAEFLNMIPLSHVGRMPFRLADEYALWRHPRLVEYRRLDGTYATADPKKVAQPIMVQTEKGFVPLSEYNGA